MAEHLYGFLLRLELAQLSGSEHLTRIEDSAESRMIPASPGPGPGFRAGESGPWARELFLTQAGESGPWARELFLTQAAAAPTVTAHALRR